MVVYNDKTYETCSAYPDTNFTDDPNVTVISEYKFPELTDKIMRLSPNFDWVRDADRNIIDIIAATPTINLDDLKSSRIGESKVNLANVINNYPYQYEGKFYTCTEDKQFQLKVMIDTYQLAQQSGVDYELSWNETGKSCVPWKYEDLLKLYFSMLTYIRSLVSAQQSMEDNINKAKTYDEIMSISVEFPIPNYK